jgi:hypothetical protein
MDAIQIFLRAVRDGGVELLRTDLGRRTLSTHTASHNELARLRQIAESATADTEKAYALLRWVDDAGGYIGEAPPRRVFIFVDEELDRRGLPLWLLSRRSGRLADDVAQLASVSLLQREDLATPAAEGYERYGSTTRGGSNEGDSGRGGRRRGTRDDYDD